MPINTNKTRPITDLTPGQLRGALGQSEPEYRVAQVEDWLYKRGAASFDEMSNLPKEMREELKTSFHIPRPEIAEEARSQNDGTVKYLLELHDGLLIETVFLPGNDHDTLCVSTQVGCAMGCAFCATASLGFERDLTAYERAAQ
jgi:23S rRNA (adenine2503-C2)-methyltransferase